MLKQIPISESIGKTIAKIQVGFSWDYSKMIVLFTDNTFIMVKSQNGFEGCDSSIEEQTLHMSEVGQSYVDFGLITQEEYDNYIAETKRKDEEYQKQRRLYEYQKLKREFEGG